MKLKLSPPWVTYFNEVKAMFDPDPEIEIEYDTDNYTIKMRVDSADKANALTSIIPAERDYGDIIVKTIIIPPNTDDLGIDIEKLSQAQIFDIAFARNPVFAFTHSVQTLFNNPITYVVFKNRVVQFFNDNLNDVYGNMSTLYENIATDIFNDYSMWNVDRPIMRGVYFCTDKEEKVGMPLGEWP